PSLISTLLPYTTLFRSPSLVPPPDESKLVPEEASSLYSQLADASTTMQERWDTVFKQMPTLLTTPEQRKAVQTILEKHLAYLARSEEHTSELQSRFDLV